MIINFELDNFDCLNYMLRNYAPFGGSFEYVGLNQREDQKMRLHEI